MDFPLVASSLLETTTARFNFTPNQTRTRDEKTGFVQHLPAMPEKGPQMIQLITRRVLDTKPVTVEYELTDYGRSVEPIINEIAGWAMLYRQGVVV